MADDEFQKYMQNWPNDTNSIYYKEAREFLNTLTPEESEDFLLFDSEDQFAKWKKFQSSNYTYTKQELHDLLHRRRLIHDRWLQHILSEEEYQLFLKYRKEHYEKRKHHKRKPKIKEVPSKQEKPKHVPEKRIHHKPRPKMKLQQNMQQNPFIV